LLQIRTFTCQESAPVHLSSVMTLWMNEIAIATVGLGGDLPTSFHLNTPLRVSAGDVLTLLRNRHAYAAFTAPIDALLDIVIHDDSLFIAQINDNFVRHTLIRGQSS